MRRRGGAGRKITKKPAGKPAKLRPASKAALRPGSSVAELQTQVEALTRQLSESQEQQAATSEVLKVISSSPGDLKPVFDVMLEKAVKLCEAKFGVLYQFQDNAFHPTTTCNVPAEYAKFVEKRGPFLPQTGNALDPCYGPRHWSTVSTKPLKKSRRLQQS